MSWPVAFNSGIGAVAAGLLSGCIALAVAVIVHRLDQRRWTREGSPQAHGTARRDAYVRFFAAVDNLRFAREGAAESDPLQRELDAASEQVRLASGPAVRAALDEFVGWRRAHRGAHQRAAWEPAERRLVVAMWEEQSATLRHD